jgi:uncharacterized protein YrzB (UPF0473 family)
MAFSKTIKVERKETNCKEVVLLAYRDDDGDDGVLITAWHCKDNLYIVQTQLIDMDLDNVRAFIRDYSSVSAQEFVDRFTY